MPLVYLDACAIIDAREKQTSEAQALTHLLVEGSDERPFITSDLTLIEVLVQPIRGLLSQISTEEKSEDRKNHDWYLANLVPDGPLFQTIPVDRDILHQAAILRARVKSMKTPDAIHVATACRSACTHFVTGDDKLIRSVQQDETWSTWPKRFEFVSLTVESLDDLRRLLAS